MDRLKFSTTNKGLPLREVLEHYNEFFSRINNGDCPAGQMSAKITPVETIFDVYKSDDGITFRVLNGSDVILHHKANNLSELESYLNHLKSDHHWNQTIDDLGIFKPTMDMWLTRSINGLNDNFLESGDERYHILSDNSYCYTPQNMR
jgi:hypothetical protein